MNGDRPHDSNDPRLGGRVARWLRVVLLASAGVLVGCGAEQPRNTFDEITRMPITEKLEEVDLGRFMVPVPVVLEEPTEESSAENLLQLDFRLVAIAEPSQVGSVERLRDRHAGKIRDEVIRVCRNTGREDLLESEWSTLKAHLLDALQPLLGGTIVRRLATPHKLVEPL